MGWAVRPNVAGVAARLRLRSGLRPTLRLRRAATPLEYRCQGDTSTSANRVTFLLLDNTSILVVLPDRRYVHCVYRERLRRYISQAGRWNWYILKGHRRRLSFDGFVFYPGDHTGYPPGIDSGHPSYWAVHVGRDGNGRARLCLDVDGYDRYFVWRLSAGWIGPLVKELSRRPMPTGAKR